jgi:hypothetical protein
MAGGRLVAVAVAAGHRLWGVGRMYLVPNLTYRYGESYHTRRSGYAKEAGCEMELDQSEKAVLLQKKGFSAVVCGLSGRLSQYNGRVVSPVSAGPG